MSISFSNTACTISGIYSYADCTLIICEFKDTEGFYKSVPEYAKYEIHFLEQSRKLTLYSKRMKSLNYFSPLSSISFTLGIIINIGDHKKIVYTYSFSLPKWIYLHALGDSFSIRWKLNFVCNTISWWWSNSNTSEEISAFIHFPSPHVSQQIKADSSTLLTRWVASLHDLMVRLFCLRTCLKDICDNSISERRKRL